jgi:hypothetical protein
MSSRIEHPQHPARRPFAFGLGLVTAAVGVFLALAGYMHHLEQRVLRAPGVTDQLTPAGHVRPAAEVLLAIQQMQLVTVEINTRVSARVEHESWRGNVAARIEAPARLLYGVDLSDLQADAVAFSPTARSYAIRLPPPRRIATEICTHDESVEVQVGWMRLRTRAGEYYLGQARRGLYQQALELTLAPEEVAMVRKATLHQVEAMVRRMLGHDAGVTATFTDGGWR